MSRLAILTLVSALTLHHPQAAELQASSPGVEDIGIAQGDSPQQSSAGGTITLTLKNNPFTAINTSVIATIIALVSLGVGKFKSQWEKERRHLESEFQEYRFKAENEKMAMMVQSIGTGRQAEPRQIPTTIHSSTPAPTSKKSYVYAYEAAMQGRKTVWEVYEQRRRRLIEEFRFKSEGYKSLDGMLPRIAARVNQEFFGIGDRMSSTASFSEKEMELFYLTVIDVNGEIIAERLGMTPQSIYNLRQSIKGRSGLPDSIKAELFILFNRKKSAYDELAEGQGLDEVYRMIGKSSPKLPLD